MALCPFLGRSFDLAVEFDLSFQEDSCRPQYAPASSSTHRGQHHRDGQQWLESVAGCCRSVLGKTSGTSWSVQQVRQVAG